jgi:hypothetical protein
VKYSALAGKPKVITYRTNIDVSKVLIECGKTMERLGLTFGVITAEAYPNAPYKGNVTQFDLIYTDITDSALTWMVKSGFLSSPTLIALDLLFKHDYRMIGMIPHIKFPNLTELHIGGVSHETEDAFIGQDILQLLDRSSSITKLHISCDFTFDAAVFVEHIGSMPALRSLAIERTCTYSEEVFRWALSDRNTSVEFLAFEFPAMDSISPNDFFLHPCLAFIDCVTEHINMYSANAAKTRTVHFAHMVRNNKAMMRLPTELVRMVFEMYDRWEEVFKS